MAAKLHVYSKPEEVRQLREYLKDKVLASYDTETTGVTEDAEIVGLSVCADEEEAYYVIIAYWDKEQQKLIRNQEVENECRKLVLDLELKNLIMHNAIFDCMISKNRLGFELMPAVFCDLMILAHVVDEDGPLALKELGAKYFGESATAEQSAMKNSVIANGGIWQDKKTDAIKEMYKADAKLLGKYGAKDALLTFRLFNVLFAKLTEDDLEQFFFIEESMPLLRDVTYQMNTVGLRVDIQKLKKYELEMQHEINRLDVEIAEEVAGHVRELPKFSINSPSQLSWLLFIKLREPFRALTKGGRPIAKQLLGKLPYTRTEKDKFISAVNYESKVAFQQAKTMEAARAPEIAELKASRKSIAAFKRKNKTDPEAMNEANGLLAEINQQIKELETPIKLLYSKSKKLKPEKFIQADKETLKDISAKYVWVKKLLKMKAEDKLLNTYVKGILAKQKFSIVKPRFKQTGTDSGRYSCVAPNFQNLPRDDKRIKSCIIARPGKSFVGADYSQLEPRVFASVSQDPRLIECFKNGEDFYSVVGIKIFKRFECSAYKKDKNAFAELFPAERQIAKAVCLAAAYGVTASKLAGSLRHADGKNFSIEECQNIIDKYFKEFPGVRKMMLERHETVKKYGKVRNLYGRIRRIPKATLIPRYFPNVAHKELPYEWRQLLNLAMNVTVQGSGASIINRAAIYFAQTVNENAKLDPLWSEVKIVSQVHDELIVESPDPLNEEVKKLLKYSMEKTTILPNVELIAEPKIAKIMSDLK